jgi:hypothetical protein
MWAMNDCTCKRSALLIDRKCNETDHQTKDEIDPLLLFSRATKKGDMGLRTRARTRSAPYVHVMSDDIVLDSTLVH